MKNVSIHIDVEGEKPFDAKGKDKKTSALAVKNAKTFLDETLKTDNIGFTAIGEADSGEGRAISTTERADAWAWLEENS